LENHRQIAHATRLSEHPTTVVPGKVFGERREAGWVSGVSRLEKAEAGTKQRGKNFLQQVNHYSIVQQ